VVFSGIKGTDFCLVAVLHVILQTGDFYHKKRARTFDVKNNNDTSFYIQAFSSRGEAFETI